MWAQRLASGDWAWPVVAPHGPGYPMFLAALLAAFDGSLKAVMAVQALVGGGTAALIAAVARRWFGGRAGWIAGLAYAFYGPAVYIDTAILGEGLLLFLLAAALWALAHERQTVATSAAAGVAFGAAALVRPTALLIAGACFVWVVVRAASSERRAASAAAFVLAGVTVMAPALVKSWSASGALSVQGYGGLNVYVGNSPLHDGRATFRLGAGWDRLNTEAPRAGISGAAAQDRYYLRKTIDEIAEYPGRFVALLAAKTLWLVQAEEARDSHSYYFFTGESALLRLLPRWTILFPLACAGFVVIARSATLRRAQGRPEQHRGAKASAERLLFVYAAGAAASVVLLVVGFRYRMPLVPALAIAAGAGVTAMLDVFQRRVSLRGLRDLRGELIAMAIAFIACHILSDPRNLNLAEEWSLTGSALITERNLAGAEAAYRRALAIDPQSGLAWDGFGLTMYNGGRLDEARSAFERAAAIDRDNSRAIFHLALVDDREGRVAQAAEGYERARSLSPFDAEVTAHLAAARRRLATELGMSGRAGEARDEMQRVVELTPQNGEAWLDIALLSVDLGDAPAAAVALQRARTLGADPARVAFAAAALAKIRP